MKIKVYYISTKYISEMYQENQKPVYDKLPKNGFMKDHANYCWKDEDGEFGYVLFRKVTYKQYKMIA